MNILISAFGCSPVKGSEYGSAWGWIIEIARRGHNVIVLTRELERRSIENITLPDLGRGKLEFVYLDIFKGFEVKDGINKIFAYPYIYIWQILALGVARKIIKHKNVELIHHLSYGGIRLPTFLWLLRLPLVLGPLGGGEVAPKALRKSYPLGGKIKDLLRDLSNSFVKVDPLVQIGFSKADLILIRTKDNYKLIPRKYWSKTVVALNNSIVFDEKKNANNQIGYGETLKIMYVGRFLYWKGIQFALHAIKRALEEDCKIEFVIVGRGVEYNTLKKLERDLQLENFVIWKEWLPRAEATKLMRENDLLLFPSLHDSGGNVILEAASHGVPTLSLDIGGPGALINDKIGIKVSVQNITEDRLVESLSDEIIGLYRDRNRLRYLGQNAFEWARNKSPKHTVSDAYSLIEKRFSVLENNTSISS